MMAGGGKAADQPTEASPFEPDGELPPLTRERELARQLRANLRRRKEQQRQQCAPYADQRAVPGDADR